MITQRFHILHNGNRASPHSQAHLQLAQANAVSKKIAKELVCLPPLFCRPEKQNRESAKIGNYCILMNEKTKPSR